VARLVEITDFGTAKREAARLEGVAVASANIRVPLEEIAADMMRIEGIMFNSGGRRGGGGWARLKTETIVKKGNSAILRTSGSAIGYKELPGDDILEKSLTEPDAPYQILKIFKNTIHFGTSRPYAAVHQYGSRARGIPKREFMRFTVKDHSRWNDIIAKHIIRPHMVK